MVQFSSVDNGVIQGTTSPNDPTTGKNRNVVHLYRNAVGQSNQALF